MRFTVQSLMQRSEPITARATRAVVWLAPLVFALPALAAAEGEGGDGQGHSKGGAVSSADLFASEPWPYIWNLLMFLILLGVLYMYVWPVVLKGLQDRESKQREDLAAAENARAQAEKAQAELKARLAEGQKEAQALIEQSRADAQKLSAELKAQTQREIDDMKQRATAEIDSARQQAVQEIASQAAMLATEVAGKILQREIQPGDHQRLVDESLNRLGEVNPN